MLMAKSKEYNSALEWHWSQIFLVFLCCKKFTDLRLIETQYNFKCAPNIFAATSMARVIFAEAAFRSFKSTVTYGK